MMTNEFVLAADVGGTHITAALIDLDHRKIILPSLIRTLVDSNGSADKIIASWSHCMLKAKSDVVVSKLCLALPGPFDYENGISLMKGQGKYDALYGMNIKQLLSVPMQTEPAGIFAENDAACFLQGEVFAGCATDDYKKIIGITLGTGLGTAVYSNGKSHSADLWSLPFHDGIAEDYLSTRWFTKRYAEVSGKTLEDVKSIAESSGADVNVRSIFGEFGKNLAEFLNYFIQKEQAEAVVIGGNIAKAYELFCRETEENILERFPSVKIKKSLLGEQSALFGAAGSWYSVAHRNLSFSQSDAAGS